MRFTFLFVVPGSIVLSAGCGGVVIGTGGAGGTGSATSSTSATNVATTGSGVGTVCGAGTPCGPTEFCDYPDNLCGQGVSGVCMLRPEDCGKNLDPTCACDGSVHSNACEANAAGVDVNDAGCGGGSTPSGMIPCGAHFCAAATDYCEAAFSDIGGEPATYTCKPLPPGCNSMTSDCSCFPPDTPCVALCTMVPGGGVGGFELDCPGG